MDNLNLMDIEQFLKSRDWSSTMSFRRSHANAQQTYAIIRHVFRKSGGLEFNCGGRDFRGTQVELNILLRGVKEVSSQSSRELERLMEKLFGPPGDAIGARSSPPEELAARPVVNAERSKSHSGPAAVKSSLGRSRRRTNIPHFLTFAGSVSSSLEPFGIFMTFDEAIDNFARSFHLSVSEKHPLVTNRTITKLNTQEYLVVTSCYCGDAESHTF